MLVAVIATGIVSGRRDKNASPDEEGREFFLAGKGINKLQAGFSMAATDFGGSGLIGAIGYCYVAGMSGIWLNLAAAPAFFIIGVLLARLFNCMDCATLPEYLGKRYSMAVRYIECFMHLCTNIASLAVQFTVSCAVLNTITGISMNLSLAISMAIVLILTSGGLRTVVNTDSVLFVIIVCSVLMAVPICFNVGGGYANIVSQLPDGFMRLDQLGWWTPVSWILLCSLGYSTNQIYIQRMIAARDKGTAVFGALFTAGFYIIISVALGLIGISAYCLMPGIEDTNTVFPQLLVGYFPRGMIGLGLAAVFAATISTGTSILHSAATLFVNDIWTPLTKRPAGTAISRLTVVVIALFSLAISFVSSDIVSVIYVGGLFYSVSAFMPMILGLTGYPATSRAVLISIIATVACSLGWEYLPAIRPAFMANVPSNVVGLVISLVLIIVISKVEQRGDATVRL